MMKKIVNFVKKETVLTVSWILAISSMFLIKPDSRYISYIDFKTLASLWSLMLVVAAFTDLGTFDRIARKMLAKTKYIWQLVSLLVLLPFAFSMFITNDVALLTFVPFSIHIIQMSKRDELIIPVVCYQTVAANLGSMLTPIGNPQNIYLFSLSDMTVAEFITLVLPYICVSILLLMAGIISIKGKRGLVLTSDSFETTDKNFNPTDESEQQNNNSKKYELIYLILFIMAVLAVAFPKIIKYPIVVLVILLVCLLINRKMLVSIDYALLFTFVGFFIFTGNLERIGNVREFLISLVNGHEVLAAILSSQLISNVPAALLLSNFTNKIPDLIIGVNLGGLGTLIASMASLISFKLLAHRRNELKGKYLLYFTLVNIIFLTILFFFYQNYAS
ncbi:MAG: citrate transporter [Lachnospiraceae bacterium]|nr:citrate transporter [Lachnospiraceae bacterium]